MNFDAVIFDMDGVITRTAQVHARAWKRMFDEFLRRREARWGEVLREFTRADYLGYVDGRPRYSGVEAFLASRGIDLPFGDAQDDPAAETVCGLGNRKNEFFNRVLDEEGVKVYTSTIVLIDELRRKGVKVGVATSSKNCVRVLKSAGIAELFEARMDGVISAGIGLRGKPEPDIFTVACGWLGVTPDRAVVVEDAVSGVQAGSRGGFGMVIGVAREAHAAELLRNGADVVVSDLAEISVEDIDDWFAGRRSGVAAEPIGQTR